MYLLEPRAPTPVEWGGTHARCPSPQPLILGENIPPVPGIGNHSLLLVLVRCGFYNNNNNKIHILPRVFLGNPPETNAQSTPFHETSWKTHAGQLLCVCVYLMCVIVCVYVCMYVCMFVFIFVRVCVCECFFFIVCTCVCVLVCPGTTVSGGSRKKWKSSYCVHQEG